jgi:hypothetical protein
MILNADSQKGESGFANSNSKADQIIFLDFDGVLLTSRTCFAYGGSFSSAKPDPVLVEALRRCCSNPDTDIALVVSSTWRECGTDAIKKLIQCDLDQYLHADWKTDVIRCPQGIDDRPTEIDKWLAEHPEVIDYRILDDDNWNWKPKQATKWLPCDSQDGIGSQSLLQLMQWAGLTKRGLPAILA